MRAPAGVLGVAAAFALMGAAVTAHAATYTVTDSADGTGVADCPADLVQGGCSLREAISASNATAAVNDSIVIQAGVNPDLTVDGATEESGNLRGDLDIADEVTITGQGAGATEIDASAFNPNGRRIFDIQPGPLAPGVVIQDLSVTGGENGDGTGGGGIKTNAPTTLRRVRVHDNEAFLGVEYGAGVMTQDELLVEDSLIDSNRGLLGAGIAQTAGGGPVTIRNTTVTNNTANGEGGGLARAIGTTFVVENSTIAGNIVSDGQGSSNFYTLGSNASTTIRNSIFADPKDTVTDGDERNCDIAGSTGAYAATQGALTSGPDAECNFSNAASSQGNLVSTNPLLGALADNGGPTRTLALLAGSPAIDSGIAAACTLADQRGRTRPADGDGNGSAVCDRGAFEVQPPPPPVPADPVPGPSSESPGGAGSGGGLQNNGGQTFALFGGLRTTQNADGSVTLTFTVPSAGTVKAETAGKSASAAAKRRKKKAAPSIVPASAGVPAAGNAALRLKLNSVGLRALKKKGSVPVKVKITFTAAGGKPVSTTRTVVFKKKR